VIKSVLDIVRSIDIAWRRLLPPHERCRLTGYLYVYDTTISATAGDTRNAYVEVYVE
jgi:hypothetical protein